MFSGDSALFGERTQYTQDVRHVPSGKRLETEMAAVRGRRFALSGLQAFKACLRREWTLMVRHKFIYIFRTCQVCTPLNPD